MATASLTKYHGKLGHYPLHGQADTRQAIPGLT
jgi:hypothetical protein